MSQHPDPNSLPSFRNLMRPESVVGVKFSKEFPAVTVRKVRADDSRQLRLGNLTQQHVCLCYWTVMEQQQQQWCQLLSACKHRVIYIYNIGNSIQVHTGSALHCSVRTGFVGNICGNILLKFANLTSLWQVWILKHLPLLGTYNRIPVCG